MKVQVEVHTVPMLSMQSFNGEALLAYELAG